MANIADFTLKNKLSEKLIALGWNIIPLTIYPLIIYFVIPIRQIFVFDADEGYNVIKAMLMVRGYPLYSVIWSDQPPMLTYLLAGVFKILGLDVNVGRSIIIVFAILLIWAFTQYISVIASRWHALAGLCLLLVLPNFVKLSVSVMVGLPAIALATVALYFITLWHRNKRNAWLILAAVVLALSVLTKLFTGFLAPIFSIGIFIDEFFTNQKTGKPWYKLPSVYLFCGTFAIVTLTAVIALIKPHYISELIFSHTGAQVVDYYAKKTLGFSWYLKSLIPLCILALAGCMWVIITKRWLAFYAIAWSFSAFIFHCLWRPVWYHHLLLLTIPAAILAGMAFVESSRYTLGSYLADEQHSFLHWIHQFEWIDWANLFLVGLFIINWALFGKNLLTEVILIRDSVQQPESENQICFEILSQINSYAPQTHSIVSDFPMFIFRANLPTPPNLAVISQKRVLSGALATTEARQIISDTKPEQILMGGKLNANAIVNYINRNYTLIFYKAPYKLYLLNDVYQQIHP
jgi:4-amino-4-deoxy-L-arabinose transferase-like glycosyltransferase